MGVIAGATRTLAEAGAGPRDVISLVNGVSSGIDRSPTQEARQVAARTRTVGELETATKRSISARRS